MVLPYSESKGHEAVGLYEKTARKALEWQRLLTDDIMAVNDDGLWTHQKFGFSLPRRNGKNEVVAMRELWGLENGEMICHTAHRTSTSRTAWVRLCKMLANAGYVELGRKKKDEPDPENGFRLNKQQGLERITLIRTGGEIAFRTRTPNGGLGEGFDLLVIDEAQEYTDEQESALVYTVSDSANPQTLFCGTPPTATSSGTVFVKMREECLAGDAFESGWAEWSIPEMTDNVLDTDLWYETNPSMGAHLNERKVRAEIGDDRLDFNIQRLGCWIRYNLKSAISKAEWTALKIRERIRLQGKLFVGIKFGRDGTNAAMSIAVRTDSGRIFVESIDCRPTRDGIDWILGFLNQADVEKVVIDGASGQQILSDGMKALGLKAPVLPTVKEVIVANAMFEQGYQENMLCHMDQPSLTESVTNSVKREIGTGGGFGYKSIRDDIDIVLMDSMIFAYWACASSKEKHKQIISY